MAKRRRPQRPQGSRRERLATLQQQQRRTTRRRQLVWGAATVAAVAAIGVPVGIQIATKPSPTDIRGLVKIANLKPSHTDADVKYPQTPPAGGAHNERWLNCGAYDSPPPNVNAVHDLEHGVVWITYKPSLSQDGLDTLRQLPRSRLVLSPYPGLPAPIVASAWGRQLRLTSASDPRLRQFVDAFTDASTAPEPGGSCQGGVGTPLPAQ